MYVIFFCTHAHFYVTILFVCFTFWSIGPAPSSVQSEITEEDNTQADNRTDKLETGQYIRDITVTVLISCKATCTLYSLEFWTSLENRTWHPLHDARRTKTWVTHIAKLDTYKIQWYFMFLILGCLSRVKFPT